MSSLFDGASMPDDRLYCNTCRCLGAAGCAAGSRASVIVTRAPREGEQAERPPHRCIAFVPLADDPDPRRGAARWARWFADAAPAPPATQPDQPRRRVRPAELFG